MATNSLPKVRASLPMARRSQLTATPLLNFRFAFLLAVLAGVLYDLAFPLTAIWPLAFLAIALLLLTLIGRHLGAALLIGFVFALMFYLLNLSFTTEYLGPVPWVALSVLQAFWVAFGSMLITLAYRLLARLQLNFRYRLLATSSLIAGLWVARETANANLPYGGFPWGRMAISQAESPFAQLVSWFGLSGLSFLLVAGIAAAIEISRNWPNSRAVSRIIRLGGLTVFITALMLVPTFSTMIVGKYTVASVQANGPSGYFDNSRPGDIFKAQLLANQLIGDRRTDLIIWPEGSANDVDISSAPVIAALNQVSRNTPLLFNTVLSQNGLLYNSSVLWRGGVISSYDKQHPVPFGEYVPDRKFWRNFAPELIDLIGRDYQPGARQPVLIVDGVKVGLAICFDVIYDQTIWDGAYGGAELYLFQTNNADFRGTDENLQQLAVVRLRAIETGRSIINISTVGTSEVIAANGRTIDSLPINVAGVMVTTIDRRSGLTPAILYGYWITTTLTWGSLLGLLTLVLLNLHRIIRQQKTH